MALIGAPEGFTSFMKGPDGGPGGIVLYDTAGAAYLLWVDTTGDLRISVYTGAAVDYATGGGVVGSQS